MLELTSGPLRSILCLGAHGDDIEIGAGATLLALLAAHPAARVHWMVFSATAERAEEARQSAADFLGAADRGTVQLEAFTDGFFPSEVHHIKRRFEELKTQVSPDIVFTHHRDDRHQDHRVISELTWNTFRNHLVLEYEIPKFDGDLGQPCLFVPADDSRRAFKVETVLRRYASQRSKPWFTRETFDALMRLRGIECRAPSGYAEAFHARKVTFNPEYQPVSRAR
jgi:LmbE family N-acetylglucosaminyl deacetylase